PWLLVMDYVAKYDPYGHPSTCHQENYGVTRVNNSAFKNNENHTWYAAQIFFEDWIAHGKTVNFSWIREYWSKSGSKPVINYESKYDHYRYRRHLGNTCQAGQERLGCRSEIYRIIKSIFSHGASQEGKDAFHFYVVLLCI
ncbi:MAG: DUF4038 domain-containing protein, partial [Ruminococcaceae bacterium]|nr:DUF4038 domain-containing protein [Oscillospiraceae bacterium]